MEDGPLSQWALHIPEGIYDLAFLSALIDDVRARFAADSRRVYMTGFSNGASMTFRFAAEFPERVAAIAPVAGYCRVDGERLPRPVPMVCFFGRMDPLTPFTGGDVRLPWGVTERRPPARDTIRAWARLCGERDEPSAVVEEPGLDVEHYGPDIVAHIVEDLGHVWPGGHRLLPEKLVGRGSDRIRATDVAWDFFRRYRCPESWSRPARHSEAQGRRVAPRPASPGSSTPPG
jgi:polyhydroxybutyrate depolymerase